MIAALVLAVAAQADPRLDVLAGSIASSKESERFSAVQQLAALRSTRAWMLIAGALKDVSPRVADEAEIQLAKCDDPEVIEEIAGKSGLLASDPWVAVHAAGALTGGRGRSLVALEAALAAKHDAAREVAYAGIERAGADLRAAGKIPRAFATVLEKAVQPLGKGGEVQAAALLALAALEPARAADWIARAEAKQSPSHLCALLALVGPGSDDAVKKLVAIGATHADRAVRASTVAALAAHPDAERLGVLVEMFAAEKNARLAWTIDGHLERLSGLAGGGKAEFWKGWLTKLGPDWKPITGEPRASAPAGDTVAPKLGGMPILSGNVAILVDLSGSTWTERADGTTVKQRLDRELETALRALPETARFNVIPYTADPIPWEKRIQPATPANVGKALKSFTLCKASGKGNFWDAAMLALEDPDVDTILVLTDGAPTGGRRWNIDLMSARFVEKNRFRRVVLDAVLVEASKPLQEKWSAWCASTGGRMLSLRLD